MYILARDSTAWSCWGFVFGLVFCFCFFFLLFSFVLQNLIKFYDNRAVLLLCPLVTDCIPAKSDDFRKAVRAVAN